MEMIDPRTPIPGSPPAGKIELRSGDLFRSGAQTVTITVNCVGVMGKGIALEAKKRHPDMFEEYAEMCARREIRPGRPVFIRRLVSPSFLLFPTKDHWRSVSNLADIVSGLRYLGDHYRDWQITSLAVPPLGCGHGGLEWAVVGPTLYRGLSELDVPVFLYVPSGEAADAGLFQVPDVASAADVQRASSTSPPEIVAIVMALESVRRDRPTADFGRILMQKLGYFAIAAGIPAPIRYERQSYGPFSADWMAQIRHLVNNGLLVEHRSGSKDAFSYEAGPSLGEYAARLGPAVARYSEPIARLSRLMSRLSPDQAEFAATTHMVAVELGRRGVTDADIVVGVQNWKRRRGKPFPADRILACLAWLRTEGWLPPATALK